jgi:hypothetical protein
MVSGSLNIRGADGEYGAQAYVLTEHGERVEHGDRLLTSNSTVKPVPATCLNYDSTEPPESPMSQGLGLQSSQTETEQGLPQRQRRPSRAERRQWP